MRPSFRILLPGACCLLHTLASGAVTASRAPIQFPSLAREEIVAVTLNSNVFACSRDNYTDLQVRDDTDHAVPAVLETLSTRTHTIVQRDSPVSAPQAREMDNQALELTFSLLPNVTPPTGLTVDTPLRDFRQRVRVEGSQDGAAWQVLVDGAVLYDLSRFVDVRQCNVSWNANTCRRFRVTFFDATRDRPDDVREVTSGTSGTNVRQNVRTEPFRVHNVRFWHTESIDAGSLPVHVVYPLTHNDTATKKKDGVFIFRSSREPLTQIALATSNRLFHRSYRLYGRNEAKTVDDGAPGQLLSSGMLTQIRFQEISRTEMTIDFPVSRFREYVLVCETSTGSETDLTITRAEGVVPRLLFAATPGKSYALLFGDPNAEYPVLPETAALQTLVQGNSRLIEAMLGPASNAPGSSSAGTWLNSSALMIGAIIGAGILLALVLVQASRKAGPL